MGRKERYARDAAYRARESARRRAYYRSHKHEISARRQGAHLERRYGISRADYDALLARQGGVCAICAKPPEKTLSVDHCHATGKVRGLLCRQCNFGLGCYGEDQAALIASLAYLGHGASDRSGSAAQSALLARAALPVRPGRIAVRTEAHLPIHIQRKGEDMSMTIHPTPAAGRCARRSTPSCGAKATTGRGPRPRCCG